MSDSPAAFTDLPPEVRSRLEPLLLAFEKAAGGTVRIDDFLPVVTEPAYRTAVRGELEAILAELRPEAVPAPADGPVEIAGYTGLKEIGAGGMGVVYTATHTGLDRRVAL